MKKNIKKIFSIFFIFIIFAFTNSVSAADVYYDHAKILGGVGSDQGRSIIYDNSGNSYIVGFFNGTVDFDPGVGITNLTSAGVGDMFILKLDSTGVFVWVKQIGSTTSDMPDNLTIDANNNLYITGRFTGTVDFDPGVGITNLTSAGNDDIFILKLDSGGDFVWVKQIGGTGADYTESVRFDSNNNLYVVGGFTGTVDFNPGAGTNNLTSAGSTDMFILKLDSSFDFVWAKRFGGSGWGDWIQSVSIDSYGNVYTTGSFGGSVSAADFDPGAGTQILTPNGNTDVFVSKLDSNGDFVWVKQIGGTDWDGGISTIDSSGNVYVTGDFAGTVDFDPGVGTTNLTSAGSNDSYILKLDNNGDFVWVKQIGTTGSDYGSYISTDSSGYIYAVGNFSNTFDFDFGAGTSELSLLGSTDMYILKLDSSGVFVYVKQFGGSSSTIRANEIYVNSSNGYVYTTGFMTGTVDFDPSTSVANLTSSGGEDVFVMVLAPDTTAPTFTTVSSSGVTNTGAIISWVTNETSSSIVEYGITTNYGTSTAEINTGSGVISHTVSLSNLQSCTTYNYRVKSNDLSSNTGTSSNYVFTTSGCAAVPVYILQAMSDAIRTQENNIVSKPDSNNYLKPLNNTNQDNFLNIGKFVKIIEPGSKGQEVVKLQTFLKNQGVDIYPLGLVTGNYGLLTKSAVGQFQLKHGIVTNPKTPGYGRVGPKTMAKINEFLN